MELYSDPVACVPIVIMFGNTSGALSPLGDSGAAGEAGAGDAGAGAGDAGAGAGDAGAGAGGGVF